MPEKPAEPPDVVADLRRKGGLAAQPSDELAEPGGALLHQLGDVDPERIVLHLHRLVEREGLGIEMERRPVKACALPSKNFGGLPRTTP